MQSIIINDHPFTLLGMVDHVCQDGKPTKLYHWRNRCAVYGCTATWEFKTPALNRAGEVVPPDDPSRHYSPKFSYKHCLEHKPKAKRKTLPTTYASRQTVTDAEVADMRKIANSFDGPRADLYQCLSLLFGVSAGSAREIVAGRRRATAT